MTAPKSLGTAYVNFMPDDEVARVEDVYGSSYRRLAEIKLRYDPANMLARIEAYSGAMVDSRAKAKSGPLSHG